jgi:hypothetical protein
MMEAIPLKIKMFQDMRFGSVTFKGVEYTHDIYVIENTAKERIVEDRHTITKEEIEKLNATNPDVIIIGAGVSGCVRPEEGALEGVRDKVLILNSEEATKKYNELVRTKRVNCVIHTTC